jgi:hypothetical protein
VAAEEFLEPQAADELAQDQDKLTDPWSEYVYVTDDNWTYGLDIDTGFF